MRNTISSLFCMSPAPSMSESPLGTLLSDNILGSAASIQSQWASLVCTLLPTDPPLIQWFTCVCVFVVPHFLMKRVI